MHAEKVFKSLGAIGENLSENLAVADWRLI
jgi:hypothetical protein